jgi:type II secretory pathway component PulF
MPLFQYKGLQANGSIAEGQLEAAGRPEAFAQMAVLGLRPVSLAERAAASASKGAAIPVSLGSISLFKKAHKVSARALEDFTRLLSSLLAAGVPLSRALVILYPCVLLTLALAVLVFLLTFFIPKFQVIFKGLGAALPLPTQIVLGASYILRSYGLLVLIGILIIGSLVRSWFSSEKGRRVWEGLILRTPMVGPLVAQFRYGSVFAHAWHFAWCWSSSSPGVKRSAQIHWQSDPG